MAAAATAATAATGAVASSAAAAAAASSAGAAAGVAAGSVVVPTAAFGVAGSVFVFGTGSMQEDLIAGFIATVVAATLMYPVDTMKTRVQVWCGVCGAGQGCASCAAYRTGGGGEGKQNLVYLKWTSHH